MDTKEKALQSLQDPKFYLENLTKIKGKVPGLIPFKLNEAQKDVFNCLNKHRRVIILKSRQLGFCLSPETRVLTSSYKWITLNEIKVGEEIVAVDEGVYGGKGSSRKMRKAVIEKKFEVFEPAFRLKMSNGEELVATAPHRFLGKVRGAAHTVWRKVEDTKVGDEICVLAQPWGDSTYEDGWFGGIADGEGCLSKKCRTGINFCVAQVAGHVLDRIIKYVQANGYNYRLEWGMRKSGESSKLWNKPVCKVSFGSLAEVFHMMGQCRPSRFMSRDWWVGKKLPCSGNSWAKVVSIEALGVKRMIDLQTSAKTFIAEGFVSHNSTAITGYLYHKTITNPGTNTAIIGYNSDLTAELLDKVKTFRNTTPLSLQPKVSYNSKIEVAFPDTDSKIIVLPSTENVGRGYTLHNALCTELAFWDKADDKFNALSQSIPANGHLIIESTPNGIGNKYNRIWMAGDNGYQKKQYGWWWGYSETEINTIKQNMNDPQRFAQEYGCEFLATGRPVFDMNFVKKWQQGIFKVGTTVKTLNNENWVVSVNADSLRVYFPPIPGRKYCMGADVAEGVMGGDYSTCVIFDRETGDEVAMWRGHIAADKFGALVNKFGRMYNNALAVIEINNHGLTTVTAMRNLMYPQMYFRPAKFDQMGTSYTDRIGWKTTRVTKPLMVDDLNETLRSSAMKIHSSEIFDEMLTFIYDDGGNFSTQSGYHDDLIMACAVAFQGFKVSYAGKLDQLGEEDMPVSGF